MLKYRVSKRSRPGLRSKTIIFEKTNIGIGGYHPKATQDWLEKDNTTPMLYNSNVVVQPITWSLTRTDKEIRVINQRDWLKK